MRTAITLAKESGGDWKILSSPEVPIHDQKQAWVKFRCTKSHEKFSEVRYRESDGAELIHRFTDSPKIAVEQKPKIEPKKK